MGIIIAPLFVIFLVLSLAAFANLIYEIYKSYNSVNVKNNLYTVMCFSLALPMLFSTLLALAIKSNESHSGKHCVDIMEFNYLLIISYSLPVSIVSTMLKLLGKEKWRMLCASLYVGAYVTPLLTFLLHKQYISLISAVFFFDKIKSCFSP